MGMIQKESPKIEHDELIDMRTHLTIAVLAASQLRRTVKDRPDAARFDAYLDQALTKLVDDIRKVDALVAQTEASARSSDGNCTSMPRARKPKQRLVTRLVRAPFHFAGRIAHASCQWAQRHGFIRLTSLAVYD
jgi:hypothetical protein